VSKIYTNSTVIINQISINRAEALGTYRFLSNGRVKKSLLIAESLKRCMLSSKDREVLVIQDTTELNYQSHSGRVCEVELGPLCSALTMGFFLHPCLVLDAYNYFPLGYSSLQLWSRVSEGGNKHSRRYKELPIEAKASYR